MTIEIETTDWVSSSDELSSIRFTVFVDEQQVPKELELDDMDLNAVHFIARDKQTGIAVGTARLLPDAHIGRMAVLKGYRRKGVGSLLINSIIGHARRQNISQLHLNAQTYIQAFYQSAGFSSSGPVFMDAGIEHIHMLRDI